ncbi:MAG: hypothetical protein LC647_16715, partial [Beggiatoa sp.]|nr:hypothetical protein [Beggiatoa sp.]
MAEERSIARDVAQGLIAGAAATWVMGLVTSYMHQHESENARRRYEEVTGGRYVPERSAEKIESALRLELSETQHKVLAQGNHWMVGLLAGATYAVARRRVSGADWGAGIAVRADVLARVRRDHDRCSRSGASAAQY